MKTAQEWVEQDELDGQRFLVGDARQALRLQRFLECQRDALEAAARSIRGLSNDEFARNRDEDGDTSADYFRACGEAEECVRALFPQVPPKGKR